MVTRPSGMERTRRSTSSASDGTFQSQPPLQLLRACRRPQLPPAAVQSARADARARRGKVAFAVVDARGIAGQAFDQRYASASLVKAMILSAYLARAGVAG